MRTETPRPLTANEQAVLGVLLHPARFAGADALAAQVPRTTVVGGIPTLLDLDVRPPFDAAPCTDGPAPIRAYVYGRAGDLEGELLVGRGRRTRWAGVRLVHRRDADGHAGRHAHHN